MGPCPAGKPSRRTAAQKVGGLSGHEGHGETVKGASALLRSAWPKPADRCAAVAGHGDQLWAPTPKQWHRGLRPRWRGQRPSPDDRLLYDPFAHLPDSGDYPRQTLKWLSPDARDAFARAGPPLAGVRHDVQAPARKPLARGIG